MAGSEGNQNAVGNSGGKTLNDRKLAAEVRTLTLKKIKKVLNNEKKDKKLYDAVLIKLSGSVLPRLNEHSGPDGEKLIPIYNGESFQKHKSDKENIQPDKKDKSNSGGNVSKQDD